MLRAFGPLPGMLWGHERSVLAGGAVWRGFSPERARGWTRELASVYLVMTSPDKGGVDIDAHHAVMDLAPLDSRVQRRGRVNRAGLGRVAVVHTERDPVPVRRRAAIRAARRETPEVLRSLEDLSPGTLRGVDPAALAR